MPEIGSRWKYKNAQIDFTVKRIVDGIAWCEMNWPEQRDRTMIYDRYENAFDSNGQPYIKTVRNDPWEEFQVPLARFEDGTVSESH